MYKIEEIVWVISFICLRQRTKGPLQSWVENKRVYNKCVPKVLSFPGIAGITHLLPGGFIYSDNYPIDSKFKLGESFFEVYLLNYLR